MTINYGDTYSKKYYEQIQRLYTILENTALCNIISKKMYSSLPACNNDGSLRNCAIFEVNT